MSEWRDAVRRELDRFRRETGSSSVSRQELLEQALPRFERQFPGAQTLGQTMSRVLQELGRRDEITLHGGGLYEIHTLSYEHGTPDVEVEPDGSTLTLPDPVVLDTSYLSARNEHHENLDWFPA
jgi:hypothetical protein